MELYRPTWHEANIGRLFDQLCKNLLSAPPVNTGHWQGKKDTPMSHTRELTNVIFEMPIAGTAGSWAAWTRPNLPWAEEHFTERVGGKPLNPPPSHVRWPYNQKGNQDHMDGQVFSHSYPERLWPRFAGESGQRKAQTVYKDGERYGLEGIRYQYGDLANAVDLLLKEPFTRQCYIPLWFPEDLFAAVVENQRVPCTLGYHMMLRSRRLHCFYPMRSLDVLRYLRDDFYMAGRLVHWLIHQCRNNSGENSIWHEVEPGMLTVHAVSVHIFEGDVAGLNAKFNKKAAAHDHR